MLETDFRIQDAANGATPLFPEFLDKAVIDAEGLAAVGFLQDGMASGKPAVILLVKMDDETYIHVQTSAAMFLTLAAGMKGAMARWGTPWEGA